MTSMETVNQENAKDVKNNFDGIKNDIDEINKTIKNYRPVWNKAGKTFEYVVLERLKTTMAQIMHEVLPFEVRQIFQLYS